MAVLTSSHEMYKELCQTALLGFVSTAEGRVAIAGAYGLLLRPTDEMTLSIARKLVERLQDAQDWSRDFVTIAEAKLAFREKRFNDALKLSDKFLEETQGSQIRLWDVNRPYIQAAYMFMRASIFAELQRNEKAQKNYVLGVESFNQKIKGKVGFDRGKDWVFSYYAEARQTEAEDIFKRKGIAIPAMEQF